MNRFRFLLMVAVSVALFTGVLSVVNQSAAPEVEAKGQSPARIEEPDAPPVASRPAYTVTAGAWRNLRPTESTLNGISMLPSTMPIDCVDKKQKSKGWIVGDSGTILGYCNGVWDHAITVESIPTNLFGVQAISSTLAVAVGEDGAILLYLRDLTAEDYLWTKSPIAIGSQWLYGVSMVPDGEGYAGWVVGTADPDAGGRGALISGTISGPVIYPGEVEATHAYTWTRVTNDYSELPPIGAYYSVHSLAIADAWAVGGNWGAPYGRIVHWDGATWNVSKETGEPLLGIRMKDNTEGWATGYGGAIYHFTGTTWVKVASPTAETLTAVNYAPDGTPWIVGLNGTLLYYSQVGGAYQWKVFTDLRTDRFDFRAVDFTDGHGWTVGTHYSKGIGGQILEHVDNLWLAVTPPTDNQLNDVSVVDDNNAWAVGDADDAGGTVIHWDGKHWQRWYQKELPIPAVNLNAIDMVSAIDGWAAGDSRSTGAPAVYLHWDGTRWAEPRYLAPVNVRVNDISMLKTEFITNTGLFGWSVADNGDAVPKYLKIPDTPVDSWSALHSCGGLYYQLRGVSVVTTSVETPWSSFWDAWAVGSRLPVNSQDPPPAQSYATFMRFKDGCSGSNAWREVAQPIACLPDGGGDLPPDGPTATYLRDIQMRPGTWGFAVGNYINRAVIHYYDGTGWSRDYCQVQQYSNPSQFNAVDIVKSSNVTWVGGFYTPMWDAGRWLWAYVFYHDDDGWHWVPDSLFFPRNGRNIWHRPIKSIGMSSDTMGWAVGDGYSHDPKKSVIYQYPFPNFTLVSLPAARAIYPSESDFFTITVNSIGGFSTNLSLTIPYLPAGISASVTPASINAGAVATVYVTTTAGMQNAAYDLPLSGLATFRSGDSNLTVNRTSYLRVNVTDHPLYAVTPDHAVAGTVVSISGRNFGVDPGVGSRNTVTNHVTWAGVRLPDANVLSWSDTLITFTPPDNPTLFVPQKFPLVDEVAVRAGNSDSNADQLFKLDSRLTGISYIRSGSIITVTVVGTSLGSDPGSLSRSTYFEHVSVNGSWVANANVKTWSNNAITFTVASSVTDGTVVVTSNGYESNALTYSVAGYKVYLPLARKG